MLPHSTRLNRIVLSVGPARLVREVSPLLDHAARVRWVSDPGSLIRTLAAHEAVIGCLFEHSTAATMSVALAEMASRWPEAQRIVITELSDLANVRPLLDAGLASTVVYRPLELVELRTALGLPVVPRNKMAFTSNRPMATIPRSAAPHG